MTTHDKRKYRRFKNKVVFVAGGSSGIGFTTAKYFLLEGAIVIICSRSEVKVNSAVDKLKFFSNSIYGETGDLSVERIVKEIFERIHKKFGRIDILVNSAGVTKPGNIEDISIEDWHYVINNNITCSFLTCKYSIKYMKSKGYGKIINVSSIAGRFRSKLSGVHYTCAKSAIIALTRQLAAEVGKYNINVNVVCPGQTRTPMLKQFLDEGAENMLKMSIPLGYISSPEQQAEIILFLASDQSNYMTGAVIDVNGGQL